MKFDFSNYKFHIPIEKTAISLLEPGHEKFYDKKEIFSYKKGLKILLEEKRSLWLPNSLMHDKAIKKYFEDLGVPVVV